MTDKIPTNDHRLIACDLGYSQDENTWSWPLIERLSALRKFDEKEYWKEIHLMLCPPSHVVGGRDVVDLKVQVEIVGMKSAMADGIKADKKKEKMKEFQRLYSEANETCRNHDEFLENIFTAAVNLHTGKWKASS